MPLRVVHLGTDQEGYFSISSVLYITCGLLLGPLMLPALWATRVCWKSSIGVEGIRAAQEG